MAGAYVMVLGMDIAGTPRPDLVDCGRLVHFFESLPLSDLAPHDDLRLGGTEYVLADLHQYYVAYASRLKGRMGLRGLPPGVYRLRWMDCASGRIAQATARSIGGDGYFEKPAGIGAEVVVYVRRESDLR